MAKRKAKSVHKMSQSEAAYEIVVAELRKNRSRPDHFAIADLVHACLEVIRECPAEVKRYIAKHS